MKMFPKQFGNISIIKSTKKITTNTIRIDDYNTLSTSCITLQQKNILEKKSLLQTNFV